MEREKHRRVLAKNRREIESLSLQLADAQETEARLRRRMAEMESSRQPRSRPASRTPTPPPPSRRRLSSASASNSPSLSSRSAHRQATPTRVIIGSAGASVSPGAIKKRFDPVQYVAEQLTKRRTSSSPRSLSSQVSAFSCACMFQRSLSSCCYVSTRHVFQLHLRISRRPCHSSSCGLWALYMSSIRCSLLGATLCKTMLTMIVHTTERRLVLLFPPPEKRQQRGSDHRHLVSFLVLLLGLPVWSGDLAQVRQIEDRFRYYLSCLLGVVFIHLITAHAHTTLSSRLTHS